MAINLELANKYFLVGSHVNAHVWSAFESEDRKAAINTARLKIMRARAYPIPTDSDTSPAAQDTLLDTDTTTESDFPREDLAVYEQAIWLLVNSNLTPDGNYIGPKWYGVAPTGNPEQISPKAADWMGWSYSTVRTIRG